MAYSAEIIRRARRQLELQKADQASRYRQRLQEAYEKVPRLRDIDVQLRSTMSRAALAAFENGEAAAETMAQAKSENLKLQYEYASLVAENFEPGYLEQETCTGCGGSGYVGSNMCRCLLSLCMQEQRKAIAALTTGAEQFAAFRLDYYPDAVDGKYGASPRLIMEKTLSACKQYATTFRPGCGNLLFVGGTGLGKTFLSACIANALTDKGFSVAYESAPQLFNKLEKNRFSPDEETHRQAEALNGSDLLIIDDLGTEMPSSFVTAALYSLVNERLLSGGNMIISTNLTIEEIAVRYSPQIASRLRGEFKGFTFVGEDIRLRKNRG